MAVSPKTEPDDLRATGRWGGARPAWWEWTLAAVVCLGTFQALRAVFASRLLRLACQDHPNFASFYHVAWNFQDAGVFRQTVHAGYVDNWLWGGHYTLVFPAASALLGLHPTPGFFNAIQLAAVCSAVFAGLLLGRGECRHPAGGVMGIAAVALSPPLLAMALTDYQDLVFCIPAVLWATVFLRRRMLVPALIACGLVAACREECLALLPVLGLAVPTRPGRRVAWAAAALLAGGAVLGVEWWVGRDLAQMPAPITQIAPVALAAAPGMLTDAHWLQQCVHAYLHLLEPLGWLVLFAPIHLLGLAGLLALHLGDTFHAVDWYSNLLHHFAPAVALATAGAVLGFGWVGTRLLRLERWGPVLLWLLLAVCVAGGAWRVGAWRVYRGAAWHAPVTGAVGPDVVNHPAWELAAEIPPEAAVATSARLLLPVMSRPRVYDFYDSLQTKTDGRGLACVHYALVGEDDSELLQAVLDQPVQQLVRELDGCALYQLRPPAARLPTACSWGSP